jgi:hypothetical protein
MYSWLMLKYANLYTWKIPKEYTGLDVKNFCIKNERKIKNKCDVVVGKNLQTIPWNRRKADKLS